MVDIHFLFLTAKSEKPPHYGHTKLRRLGRPGAGTSCLRFFSLFWRVRFAFLMIYELVLIRYLSKQIVQTKQLLLLYHFTRKIGCVCVQ